MTTFSTPVIGFTVDGVLFETSDGMSIFNRVPQGNEVQVPVGTNVEFDIATTSGTVTLASTYVWIDDVLAFSAGAFQTGFDGAASLYGNPQPDVLRIRIDPTTDFAPLAVKSVRVVSASSAAGSIDSLWSFMTEDLIAPSVVTALPHTPLTLRVTFDEPVLQVDATNSDDALNPSNWTIALESTSLDDGLPAVPLDVVSVATITDSIVELTFDWEMTPGALYRVSATSIVDLFDNVVNPGANSALFTGYALPVPVGRDFDLLKKLPLANRVEDEDVRELEAFIRCLQEPFNLILYQSDRWTEIIDPDLADERYLDAMLADLGNPFGYDFEVVEKRRLIQLLVPIYKKKGTAGGIVDAIRLLLGLEVTISVPAFDSVFTLDWSYLGEDYLGSSDTGNRFTFFVVSPIVLTASQREEITKIAEYMKAAWEHLGGIVEPSVPLVPDHLELGLSLLGVEWTLH